MAFTATEEPTTYGAIGASGNDSWFDGKVFSYAVSSAVTIARGDFVQLASSTTNTITRCSSSGDGTTFIGIALGAAFSPFWMKVWGMVKDWATTTLNKSGKTNETE